jgi:hypothetical protein
MEDFVSYLCTPRWFALFIFLFVGFCLVMSVLRRFLVTWRIFTYKLGFVKSAIMLILNESGKLTHERIEWEFRRRRDFLPYLKLVRLCLDDLVNDNVLEVDDDHRYFLNPAVKRWMLENAPVLQDLHDKKSNRA